MAPSRDIEFEQAAFRTALAISGDKHPRPGTRIIDCGTRTVTAQVRLDNLRPIEQPPNSRKAVRLWDDGAGDLAAYAVGDRAPTMAGSETPWLPVRRPAADP
jgi:hypothetical protein